MDTFILANILSLIGCILMVLTGFLRRKGQILAVQCAQFGFLGTSNLLLGANAGFVSGIVSILRNLVFSRVKGGLGLKLVFIGVQLLMSLSALRTGLIEWLPLLSAVLFTWVIDTHSEARLKFAIMGAQALWFIYDLSYGNYVAMTFDLLTVLSNLAGLWMLRKEKSE